MSTLKQIVYKLLEHRVNEHEPDKSLIVVVGIIISFGLVMLSSVSSVVAYAKFGDSYYYFKHQLFGLLLGLVAGWFVSRVDYHRWKKYALPFLIFSIILLVLVFIPGLKAGWGKAKSWINVFGFSLQPSEFVKLTFLFYLAAWLESRGKKITDFYQGSGPFVMILGFIGLLMILQPDIGTLSIISITSLIVYFVGGGKIGHIIIMIILSILSFALMVNFKPYQMDRFQCMLNPEFSTNDVCYQVNQSLIAIGSGGWLGRGLGESRQKFMYLPEIQGDSIFSIIAEETGLIFSGLLVVLYIYIFYRGYLISKYAPDGFGRILAIGIVSWITLQALINIGGMVNLLPMTGVPLPFISYGGSAIISALIAMGILVNISKQTR
ncbi:MAG: putative lipid II flippase FtsW [Patescibacteria group bacterium]